MAKKYIDADRLKAEIEKRKEEYKEDRYMSDYRGQIAYYKDKIYDDLLSFIDSLQQEQPCDTCTNDKGCVTCKDGELWEGKPVEDLEKEIKTWIPAHIVGGDEAPWKELKDVVIQWSEVVARYFYELGKQSKEPISEDLEKAANEFAWSNFSNNHAKAASIRGFKAGAEWQKEQMPMPEDTVIFQKGIEEGKRLMMEDAVEASVNYYENIPGGSYVELVADILNPTGVRYKDKVKIVIVKED